MSTIWLIIQSCTIIQSCKYSNLKLVIIITNFKFIIKISIGFTNMYFFCNIGVTYGYPIYKGGIYCNIIFIFFLTVKFTVYLPHLIQCLNFCRSSFHHFSVFSGIDCSIIYFSEAVAKLVRYRMQKAFKLSVFTLSKYLFLRRSQNSIRNVDLLWFEISNCCTVPSTHCCSTPANDVNLDFSSAFFRAVYASNLFVCCLLQSLITS